MRIGNILLVLVSLVMATGDLFAQSSDTLRYPAEMLPTVYYADGMRFQSEADPDKAREMFERAIEADPDHAPSLYAMSNLLVADGQEAAALEFASRAAALDPANRWYKEQKARLLASQGRLDEAAEIFEQMVSDSDHFDPDNYRMLALIYYRNSRTDDALAMLDSAEVRIGPIPEIVEMKRRMLIEGGRMGDAIAETEDYLRTAPYDEENRFVLAQMYAFEGRDSLQTDVLKEILDINPDNADALQRLADIYRERGQVPLFFATLKQIFMIDDIPLETKTAKLGELTGHQTFYRQFFLEIGELALILATRYAGRPEVVQIYADHAIRGGDIDGALGILKAQTKRPSQPLGVFTKIIEIEAFMKRADSVKTYADRAFALYPDNQDIYQLLAGAWQYMGRFKEARKTLSHALGTATTDSLRSRIHGAIGTVWYEEGNYRKTFAEYEKALAYDSDNVLVLNNYAYYLSLEGRELDRALGMASRASKLEENNATYLDTYAWVLYRTGDFAQAKKIMQKALPLDTGNSPELLMHYGDILWALGEEFMASVYWKRARDAGYEPAPEIEERLAR